MPEAAPVCGQLLALACPFAGDGGDHALGALEPLNRLAQLPVEHRAVGDDDHRIEQLLVPGIMQVGEECAVQAMEFVFPEPAECWIK